MKKIIFILLSVSMLCFLGACNAERPTRIEVTNMPNSSSKVVATSETTRNPVSPSPNSTSDAATMPPSDSEFNIDPDTIGGTNSFGADPSIWCGPDPDRMG